MRGLAARVLIATARHERGSCRRHEWRVPECRRIRYLGYRRTRKAPIRWNASRPLSTAPFGLWAVEVIGGAPSDRLDVMWPTTEGHPDVNQGTAGGVLLVNPLPLIAAAPMCD